MDGLLVAGIGLLAVAALALGAVGVRMLREDRATAERLARLTGGGDAPRSPSRVSSPGALDELAERAARLAVNDEETLSALRRELLHAGFRARNAAERYSAARALGAIVLGLLAVLVGPREPAVLMGGVVLVATAVGYYAPAVYVQRRLAARRRELLRTFPDALDLMVSCVEAGLGLDAALKRVGEEIAEGAPDLSRELGLVNLETNAGVPRAEALRHLADRTGLEDVASMVNVLVQAERYGTGVAQALRTHAELVRTRRMHRAEEAAQKVSPKLTVLLILFILPCLLAILVGPAAINVKNVLLPATEGAAP